MMMNYMASDTPPIGSLLHTSVGSPSVSELWITLSARASMGAGIAMRSRLAVRMFNNKVEPFRRCIGISPGFEPRTTLSTKSPMRARHFIDVRP
jgi:hypothetical protein